MLKHDLDVSTLAEIEKAVVRLSIEEQQALQTFLESRLLAPREIPARKLTPTDRANEFKRWAASHTEGPNLPDNATGRDAIYD